MSNGIWVWKIDVIAGRSNDMDKIKKELGKKLLIDSPDFQYKFSLMKGMDTIKVESKEE